MKKTSTNFWRKRGFTLLEMIGVLAIMAILSAILVPSALKGIDAASEKAEVETLRNLGAVVETYVRQYRVLPTEEVTFSTPPAIPAWATQLGGNFSGLSPYDIEFNRRGVRRIYLIDPAAPRERAIFLSLLENNLTLLGGNTHPLPRQSDVPTSAQFQSIWNTADGSIPPISSWGGWVSLNARADGGSFLVIQRVNLVPIFNNELQTITITWNNKTPVYSSPMTTPPTIQFAAKDASFKVTYGDGITPPSARTTLLRNTTLSWPLHLKDRVDLYPDTVSLTPDSSYIVTGTRSFDFNGVTWTTP